MMMRAGVLLAAGLALSGCASMSRSEAVSALPADWAANSRVEQITLSKGPEIKTSPEFDGIFQSRVKAKLDECARGTRPLRLEATIDRFDKTNPVITALIAGSNVLRGNARLVDAATGQQVAEYKIGQTVVGGRIAVVLMAEAEEQMSDAFGTELCQQAFGAAK